MHFHEHLIPYFLLESTGPILLTNIGDSPYCKKWSHLIKENFICISSIDFCRLPCIITVHVTFCVSRPICRYSLLYFCDDIFASLDTTLIFLRKQRTHFINKNGHSIVWKRGHMITKRFVCSLLTRFYKQPLVLAVCVGTSVWRAFNAKILPLTFFEATFHTDMTPLPSEMGGGRVVM